MGDARVHAEPPIAIEDFGAIQADLAAGVPREEALARARLTDAQLAAAAAHWLDAMGKEVRRGRTTLAGRYARAYVAAHPELLRDPAEEVDLLAHRAPPALAAATTATTEQAAARVPAETPRFVPSYLLEEAPAPSVPVATPVAATPPSSLAPSFSFGAAPAPLPPASAAPPTPAAKSNLKGTMLAMEIPASFKAIPFASDATPASMRTPAARPPSSPPASSAAPLSARGPARPAISGTSLALDIPEHIKNMPIGIRQPSPPAGTPAAPPPLASTAPLPVAATPPTSPSKPGMPPLEEYVRMGVLLGATPADRVDAVLAQNRWTRETWAVVDHVYRGRLAADPALQAHFQAALAAARAHRGGAR